MNGSDPYTRWCEVHHCPHGHCPRGCEHPQPFEWPDGRLLCGRCMFKDNTITPMEPCSEDNCPGDSHA